MYNKKLRDEITRTSKVLIVDDEAMSRLLLRKILVQVGFLYIEEAVDGNDALEKILEWTPDLVLLDMHMPHMDGLQLCEKLQQQDLLRDIIIIMQTSVESPEFKAQAFENGVTDYVTKPFNAKDIVSRTLAHLERQYLHKKMEQNYRRICGELEEATIMQNIILPQEHIISDVKSRLGLDIAHYYHPTSELGGDYLSVRSLPGNRIALIAADVSGHGVTAALYAFSIHTLLEDRLLSEHTPGEVLNRLNTKLYELMPVGKFATMFLCVIDTEKKELCYASAVAPPPIFFSGGKQVRLETKGHLLGTQRLAAYETHCHSFRPGDTLFLYSDSLIETVNTKGELLQENELLEMLSVNIEANSGTMLNNVLSSFYSGYSKSLSDDLSMLVCKW